ncbi:unnamed protein product, partial [Ambrosiozyma monospora]
MSFHDQGNGHSLNNHPPPPPLSEPTSTPTSPIQLAQIKAPLPLPLPKKTVVSVQETSPYTTSASEFDLDQFDGHDQGRDLLNDNDSVLLDDDDGVVERQQKAFLPLESSDLLNNNDGDDVLIQKQQLQQQQQQQSREQQQFVNHHSLETNHEPTSIQTVQQQETTNGDVDDLFPSEGDDEDSFLKQLSSPPPQAPVQVQVQAQPSHPVNQLAPAPVLQSVISPAPAPALIKEIIEEKPNPDPREDEKKQEASISELFGSETTNELSFVDQINQQKQQEPVAAGIITEEENQKQAKHDENTDYKLPPSPEHTAHPPSSSTSPTQPASTASAQVDSKVAEPQQQINDLFNAGTDTGTNDEDGDAALFQKLSLNAESGNGPSAFAFAEGGNADANDDDEDFFNQLSSPPPQTSSQAEAAASASSCSNDESFFDQLGSQKLEQQQQLSQPQQPQQYQLNNFNDQQQLESVAVQEDTDPFLAQLAQEAQSPLFLPESPVKQQEVFPSETNTPLVSQFQFPPSASASAVVVATASYEQSQPQSEVQDEFIPQQQQQQQFLEVDSRSQPAAPVQKVDDALDDLFGDDEDGDSFLNELSSQSKVIKPIEDGNGDSYLGNENGRDQDQGYLAGEDSFLDQLKSEPQQQAQQQQPIEQSVEVESQGQQQQKEDESGASGAGLNFLEEDDDLLLDDLMDDDLLDDDELLPEAAPAPLPKTSKYAAPAAVGGAPPAPAPAAGRVPRSSIYSPHHQQAQLQPMSQTFNDPSKIPIPSHGRTSSIVPAPSLTTPINPQQAFASEASLKNQKLIKKLSQEKKKSDAYDFPTALLSKHKPQRSKAPRQVSNVYTQVEQQIAHKSAAGPGTAPPPPVGNAN